MARLDPESLPGYVDRLYRAAWALCGSPQDAEDLVQETFARVLARPRWLRGGDELAYLVKVLRNTYLDSRRTAARRPAHGASLDELELADPRARDEAERALDAQALYGAIASLPEDFRLALVAVDLAGLSYREAGAVLGVREATIATRVHRARRETVRMVENQAGMSAPKKRLDR